MDKPAIVTFQMQHEEFLFLGVENPIVNPDFGKIWGNFFEKGGYDKIEPYQKEPYVMNVNHNLNPEYQVYMIGKIVGQVDAIPDGYSLLKFPAREFLVVTHEWVSEHDRIVGEDGIGQCYRYKNTVQIPNGYERYDGPGSHVMLVEREYFVAEYGWRYEYWVPIKKVKR